MSDHMQTSPGPGDASAMDASSRPFDMSMFSRSQDLAGLSDLGPSLNNLLPFSNDSVLMGNYGRPLRTAPVGNQLEQWYTNNDGPWIPKNIAPAGGHDSMLANGAAARNNPFVFDGPYRESIPPSECDTLPPGVMPSDSGYGSNGGAKPSITTGSICQDDSLDHCLETQSLAGRFQGFGMDSTPKFWGSPHGQPPPTPQRPSQATDGKERVCEHCKKTLRTNSELKKHKQRHIKPFRCDVAGCTRTAGFSTPNDLDRHKRSVHPGECVNGNRYRCPFGNCQKKEKIWPRADNFRAHVKRVHHQDLGEDDLETYIHRLGPSSQEVLTDLVGAQTPTADYSSFPLSPDGATHFSAGMWVNQDLNTNGMEASVDANTDRSIPEVQMEIGHGAALEHDMIKPRGQASHQTAYDQQNATQTDSNNVGLVEPLSEQSPFSGHSPASASGHGPESLDQGFVKPGDLRQRAMISSYASQTAPFTPTSETKLEVAHTPSQDLDSSSFPGSATGDDEAASPSTSDGNMSTGALDEKPPLSAEVSSLLSNLRDQEKLKEILETLRTSGVLKELGYRKENSPPGDEKSIESVSNTLPNAQVSCPTCNKNFGRRCELKKHMKRHERPYGCTFSDCNKRFGSKNDWKRHENSQHFLLEVWRCDVVSLDTPEGCGKVSHRRETFRQHLVNSHHLRGDAVDRKLDECRVGRNCEDRFWCGFCKKIIQIKQKGSHAWAERFDHIDDHYTGRNDLPRRQINDWKSVDPEAPSVVDGSGTESETGDYRPAAMYVPPANPTVGTSVVPKDAGRISGQKRTSNGATDGRHAKRSRKMGGNTVITCCECGEGNTRGVNPQCVRGSCQHILCRDCGV